MGHFFFILEFFFRAVDRKIVVLDLLLLVMRGTWTLAIAPSSLQKVYVVNE